MKINWYGILTALWVSILAIGAAGSLLLPTPQDNAPSSLYARGCDAWYRSDIVKPCFFGRESGKTVVIMGDSVGLQWFPALQQVYRDWRIVVLTKSACPIVDAPLFYARIHREYTECESWRKSALARVAAMKPDLVILGSSYDYPTLTQEQWTQGTRRVLQSLPERVLILRSTPVRGDHSNRREMVNAWLDEAMRGNPRVRAVEVADLACPHVCMPNNYRDDTHLTASYAASLSQPLAARLR